MRAIFFPNALGLEQIGKLAGDLRPLHDSVKNAVGLIFTGASLEAIRADTANGIAPSATGLKVAAALEAQSVPQELTPSQFFRQLKRGINGVSGHTEDQIAAFIASVPDRAIPADVKADVLIMLKKETTFRRLNPKLNQLGALLGYSKTDLDDFFIAGAKL